MVRKVGNERLANACKRAHEYGIYNYPIIVQILDRNLDRMSEEPEELPMPEHTNIRGSEYYE
jgi:hypothetical protein